MGRAPRHVRDVALAMSMAGVLGCTSDLDYSVREANWSDDDSQVVALRLVSPNAPNDGFASIREEPIRQEVIRMPSEALAEEEVLREFSLEHTVEWPFYMAERGYISVAAWSGGRRVGLLIDPDDPAQVVEVEPPTAGVNLHAFVPSPDGSLIAVVSVVDGGFLVQVDMYDVDASAFVVSFTGLEAATADVPAAVGPRWSPSGDFYLPKTLGSNPEWWRFDGGLGEPVDGERPGCFLGPLTSSGVVSASGEGLCFDRHVETCPPVTNQGTPIPTFDCGEW